MRTTRNIFLTDLRITSVVLAIITALIQPTFAGILIDNATGSIDLEKYTSVGKLMAGNSTGSAVKIGDNWALTAAHHVNGVDVNNLAFTIGGNTYTPTKVAIFEDSWGGNNNVGKDIALVQFDVELVGVESAKLWSGDAVGMVGTNVGFGTKNNGSMGTKNAGNNMIDFTGADMLADRSEKILFQDFDSVADSNYTGLYDKSLTSSDPLPLEYLISTGDSGGGLFVNYNGTDYLAGIHSFILDMNNDGKSSYGDVAGSTSVAAYSDWIYNTTGISRPVPEPASFALLGLGLAGIFFIRRKKA